MRLSTTGLALCGLLLCPFRCMSEGAPRGPVAGTAGETAERVDPAGCCGHCAASPAERPDGSRDSLPVPADEGCPCACLCQGAVEPTVSAPSQLLQSWLAVAFAAPWTGEAPAVAEYGTPSTLGPPRPLCRSATASRVLIGSLLL